MKFNQKWKVDWKGGPMGEVVDTPAGLEVPDIPDRPSSNRSWEKKAEEIEEKKKELERREEELKAKEINILQRTAVQDGLRPPNWPAIYPLVYHDISTDLPEATQYLAKQSYLLWKSKY